MKVNTIWNSHCGPWSLRSPSTERISIIIFDISIPINRIANYNEKIDCVQYYYLQQQYDNKNYFHFALDRQVSTSEQIGRFALRIVHRHRRECENSRIICHISSCETVNALRIRKWTHSATIEDKIFQFLTKLCSVGSTHWSKWLH